MFLNDNEIRHLAMHDGMLSPFESSMVKVIDGVGVLGFGLDTAGYDLRLADGLRVFSDTLNAGEVIDPKNFDERHLADLSANKDGKFLLPPHTTGLAMAVERFRMPRNVGALVIAKSTYARCGLSLNATKIVPGWEGELVLEITNQTPKPVVLYVDEGIASVLFYRTNDPGATYSGGYQGQSGVTLPKA